MQPGNDPVQVSSFMEDTSSMEPSHAVGSPLLQAMPQPLLEGPSALIKTLPLPVVEQQVPPSIAAVQLPLIAVSVKEEPHGPRPVRSIPVAGTPWSIVWSSDNRRFFFDATNRISVWNTPKDLEHNPAVLKLLEESADGKSECA